MSCHRHSTVGLLTLHINTTRPRPELSEFDCAPLAATEFISLEATSASGKTDTSLESAYQIGQSSNNGNHNNNKLNNSGMPPQMVKLDTTSDDKGQQHDDFVDLVNDKDKANLNQRTIRLLKLEPAYYMPIEPLELTCAFYVNDELDLSLTQVEWWQLDENNGLLEEPLGGDGDSRNHKRKSKRQNILLWRSNGTQRWLRQAKLKDEANLGGSEEYAIIDYVTRANRSGLMSSSSSFYHDSLPPYDSDQTTTPKRDQQESDGEIKAREKDESIELARESRLATQAQAQTSEEFHSSPIMPSTTFSSIKKPSGGDRVARSEQLVRVVHLIVNPLFDSEIQQTSSSRPSSHVRREYLCRITNKVGRLDILYTIYIDPDSNMAHFEAEKRQFLRRKLIDDGSTSQTINSNWPKSLFKSNNNEVFDGPPSSSRVDPTRLVDRAKLLIITELNNKEVLERTENSPLFIPLHLPKDLLLHNQLNQNSSSNLETIREFSLARSLQNQNQDHQQRTATRQTNGTSILMSNLLATQSQSPQTTNTVIHIGKGGLNNSQEIFRPSDSKWPFKRSINSIAFDLISRYTSNKRSLIFGNGNEQRDLSSQDSNLFHSRGYLSSNYDPSKLSEGESLTNIIGILRANEKPFNVRLSLAMKLLVPEKILNFLMAWQQQILLVILIFTCVTITVCLTSLCRRDKVADSNNISNLAIKKRRKHNKVRSGWKRKKSTTRKPHISIIDIDQQEEEEEEEAAHQSPPSASTGNELEKYVQQSGRETQTRPESGSAITTTTTNGSQVKLINSNTSSDESQLQFNNSDIGRQNGIILNTNNLNNGSSESQQQQHLDESILNSISSQLNEQASNQFHRFISSGCNSLSPSDEMNTELEHDVSGNLEADNEDGALQSRCKIGGYKSEKLHSSSLNPSSENLCFKQMNYGGQYTGSNNKTNNNNNNFLADRYRLIMVSPQEELQELLVSPPHYCPNSEDVMSHYHPLQKQLEIASRDPSLLLQDDSAYYLCDQNVIGQQQQQKVQSTKLDRKQMCHYLPAQMGQQQLYWPTTGSCKQTAAGLSQDTFGEAENEQARNIHCLRKPQDHQNYQGNQLQVQQQFFVAPPPKLRSIRESNDAQFHVDIGNQSHFIREQQQQQQSFQPKGQINMTLPARKNLSRISPSFALSNHEQLTSSSSPAASTSSSLTPAATGCFSRDQRHAQQVNRYSRQQSGLNRQYLEDALQLLDSSVNDCLLSDDR